MGKLSDQSNDSKRNTVKFSGFHMSKQYLNEELENDNGEGPSLKDILQYHMKKQEVFEDIKECSKIICEELVNALENK